MDLLFKQSSVTLPKEGDIVEGKVMKVDGSRVFVDLVFGTGIVFGREYRLGKHLLRKVKEGDALSAKVVEVENEGGYLELSVSEADKERVWKQIKKLHNEKAVIELKALEANKGGLVFEWQGIKGFLPVSQLTAQHYPRVDGGDKIKILEELQKFVGQTFSLIVLDFELSSMEQKLIFSEKGGVPEETRKLLESYKVGDVHDGVVSGVVDFGIFVQLEENLEGLVHISELDWSLVENPGDLFKQGDKVKVRVIGIEGDKISLSVKALKEDPWKQANYQKGDIVEGRVTKLSKIGSFVQVFDKDRPNVSGKIYGLSHVSEFGSQQKMESIVEIGKIYPFQIAHFDPEQHKLSLLFLGNEAKKTAEESETIKDEK
ncbi:MAG: hypothetical protein A3C80_02525 [Candidatus Ryanbacteria bacterium RIFCSPHIGHO2_02_FULL_45_43]|uniref:S1 motif domain-containing protein n=1 Tax=Candidatus Ryanbacteria bacterium RIFCSPHIGHO2_01_45_13 TaxID=1802112 RepID=A0A1G2FXF0_9BACT|nr:MAG: hypothetical protein A2718_00955 [Candidatus Ryanbacteria bacterium RIFCSPHIGHO2_01_FULL_44_130]OGZ42497.1 MAG: hypothetical protein A2W41_03800 [Candidatus Ryanbacteria bacterium RIFCSPHIGHO2_01_45_13]OGZ48514.1 MAG: hypothetical protein A3C80_02525 [Candidatus Ryanbacteria bacterium RIFCSPHIGHO2_02_FULL_45_43]OGZ50376.1 MAG: hypothetical protein A3E55_00420 [Candidatus Ryanbacteria bacterium RIFCSPHIGHO2_12_FULL_44_20]OGZ51718.1 MAG: hypothetical protein A3A17_02875 [Candidatus Ryanba